MSEPKDLRAPPSNPQAELAVLGSCLLDSERLDDVALVLRPGDFRLDLNGFVFRAMLDLRERNRRPDCVLVHAELKKTGFFELDGAAAHLEAIAESVPTAHNAVHYAELVRDCALLRALSYAGGEIDNLAHSGSAEPRELISRAEAAIFRILDSRESNDAVPVGDVLMEAMSELDKRMETKGQYGLRTGFSGIDNLVGGIRGGELVILAARPGMGKSALATNIAERVSHDAEKGVLFFSLEMHRLELAERIICGRARVDSCSARNGFLSPEESSRMTEQCNRFSMAKLFIDDAPSRNMTEISAVCRRHKRRHKLDLVIVDYLQRIHPDDGRAPREQQVAAIATRMKSLARELNVPVLCLAQLNRRVESSVEKKPRLSDLRESGAIEQEADQVWFVHRDDYYQTKAENFTNLADVLVEKNRAGSTGAVQLAWFPVFTRFETVANEDRWTAPPERSKQTRNSPPRKQPTPQSGRMFNPDEHKYPGGDGEAA